MSLFTSLRESAAPPVAVEIASGRISAASLEWRGGQPVVAVHATELLPEPALVPSLTTANTHDRASVMTALNRVLEKVGRPRRIGLVVPDAIAKVSLVRFEQVPSSAQDLDQGGREALGICWLAHIAIGRRLAPDLCGERHDFAVSECVRLDRAGFPEVAGAESDGSDAVRAAILGFAVGRYGAFRRAHHCCGD